MERFIALFRRMDEFIFLKIDKFKSSIIYQQYSEQVSTMNERSQKRLNQLMTLFALILPFALLSLFFYSNYQIRQNIKLNNDIINAVNDFSNKKTELQMVSSTVNSAVAAENQEVINARLKSIMQSKSIALTKISVNNFERQNVTGGLFKSSADIAFNDLSMADFITILYSFLQEDMAKISRIEIRKNKDTTALEGSMTVLYYGRGTEF